MSFVHSSLLEVTRMTVPASPEGLPSPSPCPQGLLALTRVPNTRSGTGLQPSSEEVPGSCLIPGNVSSSDPREGKRRRDERGRGGGERGPSLST